VSRPERELHVLTPAARTRDEFAVAMRVSTIVVLILAAWGLVALLAIAGVLLWKLAT
jgi:hypothetical protein